MGFVVLANVLAPVVLKARSLAQHPAASTLGIIVLALIAIFCASHFRSTSFNNYVRLADAMLHGHLWIDWPGRYIDAAEYHGRHYGVDGPFPVIFVLPLALFKGLNANQTLPASLLGALDVGLAWILLGRLGVARAPRLWLTLFFFAGTDLWWCAMLGDVWFFAHIACVACMLLILIELGGKRRGWLIGLLTVCGFESRFTTALAIPVYVYLLANGDLARYCGLVSANFSARKALRSYGIVLAAGAVLWVAYNEAMWGLPVDIGHTLYFHQDAWGRPTGSPFGLRYVPYQIYSFFIQGPVLAEWLQQAQWPFFKVDPHGVALTFTSPALILAFWARAPRRLVAALWAAAVLVAAPAFLYYLNGWYQFGMRHALDFEPFLLVLMSIAVRTAMPLWGSILCTYSALIGTWGVWYWNVFFRTGD